MAAINAVKIFSGSASNYLAKDIAKYYGKDLPLDAHFAIGNFLRDGLDNKDIIISSNGKIERSYMYLADLIAMSYDSGSGLI